MKFTLITCLILSITWLSTYLCRAIHAEADIRDIRINGVIVKKRSPALSIAIFPKDFFLRIIHKRNGNVQGKNATNPFVKKPNDNINTDRTIKIYFLLS